MPKKHLNQQWKKKNNGKKGNNRSLQEHLEMVLNRRIFQDKDKSLHDHQHQEIRPTFDQLGLERVPIAKDGNCMFRALSHNLMGDTSHHSDYRSMIIEHISNNREDFDGFLHDQYDGIVGDRFQAYCEYMSEDGHWGGHPELVAATHVFGCTIVVHEPTGVTHEFNPPNSNSETRTIHLLYDPIGNHYESLQPASQPLQVSDVEVTGVTPVGNHYHSLQPLQPTSQPGTCIELWWDYENVSVPRELNAEIVYDRILQGLKKQGLIGPVKMTLVVGYKDTYVPEALKKDERIDIEIARNYNRPPKTVTETKGDQAADYAIRNLMQKFLRQARKPQQVVLFSGDDGFKDLLKRMKKAGHTTRVFHSRKSRSGKKRPLRTLLGLPAQPIMAAKQRRLEAETAEAAEAEAAEAEVAEATVNVVGSKQQETELSIAKEVNILMVGLDAAAKATDAAKATSAEVTANVVGSKQQETELNIAKEVDILMVGLDAAGKTTILYMLQFGVIDPDTIDSTNGLNIETVEYKNIGFTVWDVGGLDNIRPMWRHYFPNTQGVIFVVDSNDRERLAEARYELHNMLNEDELRDAVLLVFANKQDLPNAMNVSEITDELDLHSLLQHHWYVQSTCATSGEGLYEGLDWLYNNFAGV